LRLFGEIKARGYPGSYDTVARYARRLRQAQGLQPRPRHTTKLLPVVSEPQKRSLTPRRAAHLVLRQHQLLEPDDEQLVQRMAQHPELAEAIQLAQNFAFLVRQRQPDQLDSWLEQALKSQFSPFHRFAKRLQEDYNAVKAGVTLPWSNGQTEGQITSAEDVEATDVWSSWNGTALPTILAGGVKLAPVRQMKCIQSN